MKLEFLIGGTLQISLDERRACHPPPLASPIAWSGLHQEYENGSGKKMKRVEFKNREEEERRDEGEERGK